MSLQRLGYKSTEKRFDKTAKRKTPNVFSKTNIFEKHKISKKRWIKLQHLKMLIAPVLNETTK